MDAFDPVKDELSSQERQSGPSLGIISPGIDQKLTIPDFQGGSLNVRG